MDKDKQPLMDDLEQGTELSTLNEARAMIMNPTNENETRSGNVPKWSEGYHYPNYGANEKAKVILATTKPVMTNKPDSCSDESKIPGLWPSSFSHEYCCIYRVPNRLRRVNPEAYTPQMLLIGPLHHSRKLEAPELGKTDSRYLDYMSMELHKKRYLKEIASIYGDQTVEEFKKIIEKDEKFIRESYAESTEWIGSQEFVEMILHDSVFILRFLIQIGSSQNTSKKDDTLFQEPCLVNSVLEDLTLLENQLPYALLESLFELLFPKLKTEETLRNITLRAFQLEGKIREGVNFRHFTDLFRRVRVETLGLTEEQITTLKSNHPKSITSLHNADKLDSARVKFKSLNQDNESSLVIRFEGRVLKMPCFVAEDNTEKLMRNLMALEQCHYLATAFICNYVAFLDFLIDTEKDVDLLVKEGVVKNWLGHQGKVAEMVNKLCLGLVDYGSYYYPVAEALNKHYKKPLNRALATLRRVYFKDIWTATATIAAAVLLVLTLIQTVASVLQVIQGANKSPSPPPPPRL